MEQEVWKNIEEFPGYQVSSTGRIKSLSRKIWRETQKCFRQQPEKIMKTFLDKKGYATVCLKKDAVQSTLRIHRLVGLAFVDNPNNLPEINHIDSNRSNNLYSNLEWMTHADNQRHAYRFGNRDHKGDNHPQKKINSAIVSNIRSLYAAGDVTQKELASKYGLCVSHIQRIVNNKVWQL